MSGLSGLKKLWVYACPIDDISVLPELMHLKDLVLHDCENITDLSPLWSLECGNIGSIST
jgi:hypothetical protein